MKIFATITTIFLSGMIFSQNSYLFEHPVPSNEHTVDKVEASYFGKYQDKDSRAIYEFTAEGVFITSMNMSTLPKKVVRESSKYSVKKGFIHGVVIGDSIPCVLQKGLYYFGVHNREAIVHRGTRTTLTKVSSEQYILNYFENGAYIPVKISFKGSNLTISDFDYDQEKTEFGFVKVQSSQISNSLNRIVLSPSVDEFKRINNTTHFIRRIALEELID